MYNPIFHVIYHKKLNYHKIYIIFLLKENSEELFFIQLFKCSHFHFLVANNFK